MTNRRDFLNLMGLGIASLLSDPVSALAQQTDMDLVVFNARVRTIDPRTPIAEAFAIRAGRFVAVGSNQNIKALIGSKSQTWDARQMAIVPGFIDAHNHGGGEGAAV